MATPFMKTQSVALNIQPKSPGSAFIPTVDANNNPVDVHTGYTVGKANALQNNANENYAAPLDLTGQSTISFSSTGVTISWTSDQAMNIANALLGLQSAFGLSITNDSGTTQTMINVGSVVFNNPLGLGI